MHIQTSGDKKFCRWFEDGRTHRLFEPAVEQGSTISSVYDLAVEIGTLWNTASSSVKPAMIRTFTTGLWLVGTICIKMKLVRNYQPEIWVGSWSRSPSRQQLQPCWNYSLATWQTQHAVFFQKSYICCSCDPFVCLSLVFLFIWYAFSCDPCDVFFIFIYYVTFFLCVVYVFLMLCLIFY